MPHCPHLWREAATSSHRSPVPLGATGLPTCLELPGRAHPASGGGTCPGHRGCGSTPFPSCSVLQVGGLPWPCRAGVWIRSRLRGPRRVRASPAGSPCPHARTAPNDLPDCPSAQTPLHRAGLPPPPRPGVGPYDSFTLLGRLGGEREPAKHGAVCSQRGSRSRGGCWAVPGRARPQAPASPLPTQPGDGHSLPREQPAEAAGLSFSPWTQLCVLRAPPCASGPERLPELSLEAPRKLALTPVCPAPLPQPPATWGHRMWAAQTLGPNSNAN